MTKAERVLAFGSVHHARGARTLGGGGVGVEGRWGGVVFLSYVLFYLRWLSNEFPCGPPSGEEFTLTTMHAGVISRCLSYQVGRLVHEALSRIGDTARNDGSVRFRSTFYLFLCPSLPPTPPQPSTIPTFFKTMRSCPFTNEGLIAACGNGVSNPTEGDGTITRGRHPHCWSYGQDADCNDCCDDNHERGVLPAVVDGHQHQQHQYHQHQHQQHHQMPAKQHSRNTVIDDINLNINNTNSNANTCGGIIKEDKNNKKRQQQKKQEQQEEKKENGEGEGESEGESEGDNIFGDTGGVASSVLPPLPLPLMSPPPRAADDGDEDSTDVADVDDKPAPGDLNQQISGGESRGSRGGEGYGTAAAAGAGAGGGRQLGRKTGAAGGAGGRAADEGAFEVAEGEAAAVTAAKRPCARAPSVLPLPPQSPPAPSLARRAPRQQQQQQQQHLSKVSLAWCHRVRVSGVIALMKSGRLGRHTRAFDGTGLRSLEDGHVEVLLAGLPLLQVKEDISLYISGLLRSVE